MKNLYNTDHYIEQGSGHAQCEDYALSGIYRSVPYIIVSDGCGSSDQTDVGARLTAHSFKAALASFLDSRVGSVQAVGERELHHELRSRTLVRIRRAAETLRVPLTACDATLLAAFVLDGKCRLFRSGDGTIIFKNKQGFEAIHTEYADNTPYYLSYLLDARRNDAYQGRVEIGHVHVKQMVWDQQFRQTAARTIARVDRKPQWFCLDAEDLEWVIVTSDGLSSYAQDPYKGTGTFKGTGKENCDKGNDKGTGKENSGFERILQRVAGFKSFNGNFVERRMKRLQKECGKEGMVHYDDVSVAAIYGSPAVSA